jgi:GT2 family glycosyltransferase
MLNQEQLIDKTLAIVVLYEIDIKDATSIKCLNDAINFEKSNLDILIYDNSRTSMKIDNSLFPNLNIKYKHDSRNMGLGIAYNFGAKLAQSMNKKWILLLDQDTLFENEIFDKYLLAIYNYPSVSLFAPILKLKNGKNFSPCFYFFKRGFMTSNISTGLNSLHKYSPVNSGMLIRIESFLKCGGYNENIKLDFNDFQFIERFRKFENQFVVTSSVGIQDFSNDTNDISKLNIRYAIYCDSAKNCEKISIVDKFKYFIVVLQRSITLSLRTKSLIYFRTFYTSYLK